MTTVMAPATVWTGMVPVDDTALYATDTGGTGLPVIYCHGQFATQDHRDRMIAELGPGFRHITFDGRGRGRSEGSAGGSFQTAVADVDAVLAARGVHGPVLAVGWFYGGFVAAHWSGRNPHRRPHTVPARLRALSRPAVPLPSLLRTAGF